MKTKCNLICTLVLMGSIHSAMAVTDKPSLKILQMNLWHGTGQINKFVKEAGGEDKAGFEGLVKTIVQTTPDLITLSEANDNINSTPGVPIAAGLVKELKTKGLTYDYYNSTDGSVAILSKYTIVKKYSTEVVLNKIIRTTIDIYSNQSNEPHQYVTLYSGHLDYRHYATFLPRGYYGGNSNLHPDPSTLPDQGPSIWSQLPNGPIIDTKTVLNYNDASSRDESIKALIKDCASHCYYNNLVFFGGDLNEPSWQDWTNDSKNKFEHNGAIIPWTSTRLLNEANFIDSFRQRYPDPNKNPGITYPTDNMSVPDEYVASYLTYAPDADERERIDYVFYKAAPKQGLKLESVELVGPSGSIRNGQRVENKSNDKFITPIGTWPSDHKALLSTFSYKTNS